MVVQRSLRVVIDGDNEASSGVAQWLQEVEARSLRLLAPLLAIDAVFMAALAFDWSGAERAVMLGDAACATLAATFAWWRRPSLEVRSLVVIAGLTGSAALALPLFGPTMGTGLLFFAAILTASFRHAERGAAAIIAVLGITFVVTALVGPGPHAIALPPRTWVRVGTVSSVILLASTYAMLRLRALVVESMARQLAAQARAQALEQRQRELLAAAATSQRLEAVGQLAGGVAHDFNNALTIIRSGLELLAAPASDDERREVLAECAQGVERATTTTRQLLSFARVRHDEHGTCVPADVVRAFHHSMARVLPANVRFELDEGVDRRPIGLSAGVLEQALLNVTLNARDALPASGGLIRLRCRGAGPVLELSVEDSGSGMSDEVKARAFTPFFSTKGDRGTGLGLAMVQATAERAGGVVGLESTLGVGTVVTLRLPAVESTARVEPATAREGTGQGASVLVADGQPPVRAMLRRLLEREGYRVFEADSVGRVGAVLAESPIAVVIADGVLSDGGVAEVRARCAALRPAARVLQCSADPGLEEGPETLRKPFEPQALVSKVSALLPVRT